MIVKPRLLAILAPAALLGLALLFALVAAPAAAGPAAQTTPYPGPTTAATVVLPTAVAPTSAATVVLPTAVAPTAIRPTAAPTVTRPSIPNTSGGGTLVLAAAALLVLAGGVALARRRA